MPFMETSAKANINVEDAFVSMAKSIKKKIDEKVGDWVPAPPKWPFASMTSSSPNTNKQHANKQLPRASPQCPSAVVAIATMKRKPPSICSGCSCDNEAQAAVLSHCCFNDTSQLPMHYSVPTRPSRPFHVRPIHMRPRVWALLCASAHAALPTRSLPRPSQARASPATRSSVTLVARPRSKGFWLACAPSCRTAVRP